MAGSRRSREVIATDLKPLNVSHRPRNASQMTSGTVATPCTAPNCGMTPSSTAKGGRGPDYAGRLIAAFDGRSDQRATRQRQPLVEPLSERELEVLRLLATDLDGPDIARELVVSLNTMRTHTKSIFSKLGVNSRRAAVRRAAELELLVRIRDR